MKKIALVTVILATLAGCSASTVAEAKTVETVSTAVISKTEQGLWNPSASIKPMTLLAKEAVANQIVIDNTARVALVTENLSKYVHKTWYVFAGSTPRGWDCSGLVMWYYKQLGINLKHNAYIEKYAAKPHNFSTSAAKVGDIIAFPGHVGIYVGNGYMIHSPHPGLRTQRTKVWEWAKDNWTTNVTYTRLIKTK